jgi:ubiquitin C-terminal hydrolase
MVVQGKCSFKFTRADMAAGGEWPPAAWGITYWEVYLPLKKVKIVQEGGKPLKLRTGHNRLELARTNGQRVVLRCEVQVSGNGSKLGAGLVCDEPVLQPTLKHEESSRGPRQEFFFRHCDVTVVEPGRSTTEEWTDISVYLYVQVRTERGAPPSPHDQSLLAISLSKCFPSAFHGALSPSGRSNWAKPTYQAGPALEMRKEKVVPGRAPVRGGIARFFQSQATPTRFPVAATPPTKAIATASAAASQPLVRGRGLRNLGNTCYLNAVVIAILHCRWFARAIVCPALETEGWCASHRVGGTPLSEGEHLRALKALKDIALALAMHDRPTDRVVSSSHSQEIRPDLLKRMIGRRAEAFATSGQQDAHEFLINLLDALDDECRDVELGTAIGAWSHSVGVVANPLLGLARAVSKLPHADLVPTVALPSEMELPGLDEVSVSRRSMHIELCRTLTCCKCRHLRTIREHTPVLSLDLPAAKPPSSSSVLSPPPLTSVSLQELLDQFFSKRVSEYRCEEEGCTSNTVEVVASIARLPCNLALHLNRFVWESDMATVPVKNCLRVIFPERIDLGRYLQGEHARRTGVDLWPSGEVDTVVQAELKEREHVHKELHGEDEPPSPVRALDLEGPARAKKRPRPCTAEEVIVLTLLAGLDPQPMEEGETLSAWDARVDSYLTDAVAEFKELDPDSIVRCVGRRVLQRKFPGTNELQELEGSANIHLHEILPAGFDVTKLEGFPQDHVADPVTPPRPQTSRWSIDRLSRLLHRPLPVDAGDPALETLRRAEEAGCSRVVRDQAPAGRGPPSFALTGVIRHHGSSTLSGHYTTDVRGSVFKGVTNAAGMGAWRRFDDEAVRAISSSTVTDRKGQEEAYLLFYELRTPKERVAEPPLPKQQSKALPIEDRHEAVVELSDDEAIIELE